jgi:hypothetical protein
MVPLFQGMISSMSTRNFTTKQISIQILFVHPNLKDILIHPWVFLHNSTHFSSHNPPPQVQVACRAPSTTCPYCTSSPPFTLTCTLLIVSIHFFHHLPSCRCISCRQCSWLPPQRNRSNFIRTIIFGHNFFMTISELMMMYCAMTVHGLRWFHTARIGTYTRCPFSSRTRKSPFSKPEEMVAMFMAWNARRNWAVEGTTSGLVPGGYVGVWRYCRLGWDLGIP